MKLSRPPAGLAALVGTVAALGLVAGCGGGNDFAAQPPEKIVDAAKSAMKDLDSVHVSGQISSGGDDISLEIRVSNAGDCTGTFGTGGGNADILSADGTTWFKPDEAFWRQSAGDAADAVIATVGDRWVTLPDDDDSFDQFCDIDQLLEQMLADDGDDKTYTAGEVEEIEGEDAIAVVSEDKSGSTGDSTGYVRVDGDHYLVRIEKEGDDGGRVDFGDFDEAVEATAPAEDDQVDLADLG